MFQNLYTFFRRGDFVHREDGAVSVEWIVLTATIVAFAAGAGLSMTNTVSIGAQHVAGQITD